MKVRREDSKDSVHRAPVYFVPFNRFSFRILTCEAMRILRKPSKIKFQQAEKIVREISTERNSKTWGATFKHFVQKLNILKEKIS